MKKYKIAFSNTAPEASDVLWAQPIGDGFTLRLCMRGEWKPIKLAYSAETSIPYDDILIGGDELAEIFSGGGSGGTLPVYTSFTLPSSPRGSVCFCTDAAIDSNSPFGIPLYSTGTDWVTALGTDFYVAQK